MTQGNATDFSSSYQQLCLLNQPIYGQGKNLKDLQTVTNQSRIKAKPESKQ